MCDKSNFPISIHPFIKGGIFTPLVEKVSISIIPEGGVVKLMGFPGTFVNGGYA